MKQKDGIQFYENQQRIYETELKHLESRKSSFAWLRLGAIGAILIVFYLLSQVGPLYVAMAVAVLLIIFIRLVYADLHNHEQIHFVKTLIGLYQKEIKSLKGEFPFANGKDFIDKEHPYTSDLDIFGEGSLFQYLNRTSSDAGAEMLASFLKEKSGLNEIKLRQESVA